MSATREPDRAERALDRAVRLMRLLGFMALCPVVIGLPQLILTMVQRGARTALFFGSGVLYCLFFCAGCYTFCAFVRRRQLWAGLASLALAGVTVLLFLVAIVRLARVLWNWGEPRLLIPIALASIVMAGLLQLTYYLIRALPALREAATPTGAFEPVMTRSRGTPLPNLPMAAPPPPTGDALRPLHLAIRSTRLLGIVSGAFGLVFVIAFGYLNRYQHYRPHFIAMGLLAWFIPGVLFFTAAAMMKQRRRTGATIAIGVAIVQELIAIAALASSVLLPPVSPVPIVLSALWIAALAQLIWHLRLSLPLLEQDPQRLRGFEIATPQRVLPAEDTGGD